MKMLPVILFCFFIILFSCTKTNITPNAQAVPVQSQNMLQQNSQNPVNILTSHQWIYQGLYSHYIDDQNKGQRFYDRDSTNNLDEYLASVVFTFNKNHSFTKYVSPFTYHGTWQFSDAKPIFITLRFTYGNEKYSILVLTTGNFNYLQKDNYSHWYTALIPAK